jgi:hypothetical protein
MELDTIRFEREAIKWGEKERELIIAKIIINGMPLIETVYAYELPHAKKYNQENIAGGYTYCLVDYLRKLLRGQQKPLDYEKEVPILHCGSCGGEGCWDFVVTIEENETDIIWKNFRNPRRSNPDSPGGFWDYRDFPSFRFEKKQYQNELEKLALMEMP